MTIPSRIGFSAVGSAEVAAAAGVTRQLVYRFFPSRQALIMGVLEDLADDLTIDLGKLFLDHVLQANEGCDFDYLRGRTPVRHEDTAGPSHS